MIYLITGGTGTFGQAMTRHLLGQSTTEAIRILSRGEYAQSMMREKFSNDERLRFFIGDVRDKDRVSKATCGSPYSLKADVIYHAAALKQVPVCEYNPKECYLTNVVGTQNIIEAAVEAGVGKVVFISSDKAVEPINTYGASKMMAERLVIQAAYSYGNPGPSFSVVRYGNVWGSRGGVVELFDKLCEDGETLPLTDAAMTRFHISIEDSLLLADIAAHRAGGGQIITQELPAYHLKDLASVFPAEREYKGQRPGEKIHELLYSVDEASRAVYIENTEYILRIFPAISNESIVPISDESPYRVSCVAYSSDNPRRWIEREELQFLYTKWKEARVGGRVLHS